MNDPRPLRLLNTLPNPSPRKPGAVYRHRIRENGCDAVEARAYDNAYTCAKPKLPVDVDGNGRKHPALGYA